MPDKAPIAVKDLPEDVQETIRQQIASGRYASSAEVVAIAVRLLEQNSPANGGATTSGLAFDLGELQNLHTSLDEAKKERDFVVGLTSRQRSIPHPEAILQATAEQLGTWLRADRVGFFTVVGEAVEFSACWTSGRIAPLRGRMSFARLGAGLIELARSGQAIVTENVLTDPALNGESFAHIKAMAMLTVPLIRDMSWTAGLYVHHGEPRHWSAGQVALASKVAELTWDAVERTNLLRRLGERIDQQDTDLVQAASDLRDETAGRVSAEGQVRQLQKMEAVGQLTGGIAHDFNNMLAVVIGGLNLMQRRLARGDTNVTRFLDSALDGATRAANLTHRLLAFSRQQPLTPEPVDPNRLIAGMDELLDRTLGDQIKVETVLMAGLWATKADVSQLENTLLNLAVNARDAMPEGGRLTIETSNVHVDAAYADENEVVEGQYVVLAVTDTGTGMTPDVLQRVFEPFYTTKGPGKGTGLGLSQVFGFVSQSHGVVKIYSEPGVGTTIKVYLPRFYGEAEIGVPRRIVEPVEPKSGDRHEIILVVEDEERVRHLTSEALRELGYTVIHAASGAEALGIIESGQDVTLLFTDIVMPGMTGRQLVDKVRPLRPTLKVLYTTGFTRNAVVHNGVLDPGTNLLPKPFSLDLLATTIRRVLDAA